MLKSVKLAFVKAKKLGYCGESLAADYLRGKGYKIIEGNFTVRGGELDIIARKNSILVFVEVKTRTGASFGAGEDSMTRAKKQRLNRVIAQYLYARFGDRDIDWRMDLVEIELGAENSSVKNINHFEDIEL